MSWVLLPLAFACASPVSTEVRAEAPAPSSPLAETMVDVRTPADFLEAQRAYAEVAEAGGTLVVRLHAGSYASQSLILNSPERAPRVSIRVEGAQPGTTVSSLRMDLGGRAVMVRHLQVGGSLPSGVALKVAAIERVDLEDLRFVGLAVPSGGGRRRNGALELMAMGPSTAGNLTGLWYVGNDVGDAPVAWLTHPGANFGPIRVADSVWVDTGDRPTIVCQTLDTVEFDHNVVVRLGEPFVSPMLTRGQLRFVRSWLAVPEVDGLVVAPSKAGATPMEFAPVAVSESHVFGGTDEMKDPGVLLQASTQGPARAFPSPEALARAIGLASSGGSVSELVTLLFP